MDKEIIDIIKSQTGVSDELQIERVFYECNSDIVKTIMKISNINDNTLLINKKENNVFDNIRTIVDEKEKIYQNRNKGT
jgi:hypothetical protein